jgi:hypothetical protein
MGFTHCRRDESSDPHDASESEQSLLDANGPHRLFTVESLEVAEEENLHDEA